MQNASITVSIILPALLPDGRYIRCLASIRAALAGRISYEILSVVANKNAFAACETEDMTIIQEEEAGIYNAMNLGLTLSAGTYVYFIGQDDILLPGAADASDRRTEAKCGPHSSRCVLGATLDLQKLPAEVASDMEKLVPSGTYLQSSAVSGDSGKASQTAS